MLELFYVHFHIVMILVFFSYTLPPFSGHSLYYIHLHTLSHSLSVVSHHLISSLSLLPNSNGLFCWALGMLPYRLQAYSQIANVRHFTLRPHCVLATQYEVTVLEREHTKLVTLVRCVASVDLTWFYGENAIFRIYSVCYSF